MFDKQLRPCQEKQNMVDFLRCFRQDLVEQLYHKGHRCLPTIGSNLIVGHFPNFTVCTNASEGYEVYKLLTKTLLRYINTEATEHSDLKCKLPCIREVMTLHSSIVRLIGKRHELLRPPSPNS